MPAHSPTPLTPEALTALLHRLDPMGTGCAHNEGMEDEYAHQASDILERLAQGEEPRQATVAVFDYWFWEGCLDSAPRQHSLNAIARALQSTCALIGKSRKTSPFVW